MSCTLECLICEGAIKKITRVLAFTELVVILCLAPTRVANSQLAQEKANSPSESISTMADTFSSGGNTTVEGFLNITDGMSSCA